MLHLTNTINLGVTEGELQVMTKGVKILYMK